MVGIFLLSLFVKRERMTRGFSVFLPKFCNKILRNSWKLGLNDNKHLVKPLTISLKKEAFKHLSVKSHAPSSNLFFSLNSFFNIYKKVFNSNIVEKHEIHKKRSANT